MTTNHASTAHLAVDDEGQYFLQIGPDADNPTYQGFVAADVAERLIYTGRQVAADDAPFGPWAIDTWRVDTDSATSESVNARSCYYCAAPLAAGQTALAEEVKHVDTERVTVEVRLICARCESVDAR